LSSALFGYGGQQGKTLRLALPDVVIHLQQSANLTVEV
jgi:hypothetical protein